MFVFLNERTFRVCSGPSLIKIRFSSAPSTPTHSSIPHAFFFPPPLPAFLFAFQRGAPGKVVDEDDMSPCLRRVDPRGLTRTDSPGSPGWGRRPPCTGRCRSRPAAARSSSGLERRPLRRWPEGCERKGWEKVSFRIKIHPPKSIVLVCILLFFHPHVINCREKSLN